MKNVIVFLSCILVIPFTFAQPGESEQYKKGEQAYRDGNYEEALTFFLQDLSQNPKSGYSNFSVGVSYIELGQFSQSIPYFDKSIKYLRKGDRPLAYQEKAIAYINMNEYSAALEVLDLAIKKYPKAANCYLARGRLYFEMEYLPSAQRDIEMAMQLMPNAWEAPFIMALIHEASNEIDKAVEWAEKSISINRNIGFLHFYTSSLYTQLQQYEKAIDKLSTYIQFGEFNPDFFDIVYALADTVPEQLLAKLDAQAIKYPTIASWTYVAWSASMHNEEFHRALQYSKKTFELMGDSTSLEYLITTEKLAGEYGKAIQHTEKLQEWGVSYEKIFDRKVFLLFADCQFDRILQLYDSVYLKTPNNEIYLVENTKDGVKKHDITNSTWFFEDIPMNCYACKGEWEKVIQYSRLTEFNLRDASDSVRFYNFMIKTYLISGDTASARQAAQKAITAEPDRILEYYVLGDTATAQRYFYEKCDFDSEYAQELYNIATVYAFLGDTTNAMKYLRKSFENGIYYSSGDYIRYDTDLYNLQKLPEFKALIDEYAEKRKR